MGQIYVPTCSLQSQLVGNIPSSVVTATPLLFVKVDGVTYVNGYRFNTTGGFRNVYASYVASTGNVYLNSYTFAVSDTVPAWSTSNVEVLLIG